MPSIVRRIIKGIPYYYLEHTLRDNDKFTQKSMYLGRTVPKDIGKMKRQFILEIDQQKWFKTFEKIRENYTAEVNRSPKSARKKELLVFSVKFTYNTQRIEGSTLTLRETAQLLEEGISPSGKPIADVKEAEAHRKVFFEILESRKDLTLSRVLEWHWSLFKETKPDIAGKIRRHGVKISGSKFVPPAPVELQALLTDFFKWYNLRKRKLNPVELAALVHLKLVTIHPFTDGNGRISRLMMNFILQKHGYPMLNIDYKKRRAYYSALERSQLSKDERIFAMWLFRRYEREFRSYE